MKDMIKQELVGTTMKFMHGEATYSHTRVDRAYRLRNVYVYNSRSNHARFGEQETLTNEFQFSPSM